MRSFVFSVWSGLLLSLGLLAPSFAGSGSGDELYCHKQDFISYENGELILYEQNDSQQQTVRTLPSEKLSELIISSNLEDCFTKDGNKFSAFNQDVIVFIEHENLFDKAKKQQSKFLCTRASDGYPNSPDIDTTCVKTHLTRQSLKDTSLKTEYFINGKRVDALPK